VLKVTHIDRVRQCAGFEKTCVNMLLNVLTGHGPEYVDVYNDSSNNSNWPTSKNFESLPTQYYGWQKSCTNTKQLSGAPLNLMLRNKFE
jgi:hypothetical protein